MITAKLWPDLGDLLDGRHGFGVVAEASTFFSTPRDDTVPQITSFNHVADEIEDFFDESNDEVGAIARKARRLVLDAQPGLVETLDRGNRIVGYATGPRAMKDLWVGIAPHGHHVNLQLTNGALIDDPAGIVEGTGKRIRHVKLHSGADVTTAELHDVLRRSLERHLADTA